MYVSTVFVYLSPYIVHKYLWMSSQVSFCSFQLSHLGVCSCFMNLSMSSTLGFRGSSTILYGCFAVPHMNLHWLILVASVLIFASNLLDASLRCLVQVFLMCRYLSFIFLSRGVIMPTWVMFGGRSASTSSYSILLMSVMPPIMMPQMSDSSSTVRRRSLCSCEISALISRMSSIRVLPCLHPSINLRSDSVTDASFAVLLPLVMIRANACSVIPSCTTCVSAGFAVTPSLATSSNSSSFCSALSFLACLCRTLSMPLCTASSALSPLNTYFATSSLSSFSTLIPIFASGVIEMFTRPTFTQPAVLCTPAVEFAMVHIICTSCGVRCFVRGHVMILSWTCSCLLLILFTWAFCSSVKASICFHRCALSPVLSSLISACAALLLLYSFVMYTALTDFAAALSFLYL